VKEFKVISLYFFLIVNLFSGLHLEAKSIVSGDIIEGQAYQPNFLKQKGHFEKNANGTTAYADAAGTRPVDGSGGAPTLSCTRTTSSPIDGDGSLLITKDAANRQGQGCTIQFTIDSAYKAKVLQIEFDYLVASGTFTAGSSSADSDLIVYIYDVTNSTLIEPSSIKLLSNSSTISDHFVANFQTSATGTTYNLILHQATTSASAYTVKADNFVVKPSQYVYGTPITDWVSYTPTVSNLGTGSSTSNVAKYRRVGDSMETMVTFQKDGSGGSGASVVTWSFPSGLSADATKLPFGSATAKADNIGSAWVVSGGNYSASDYEPLVNSATTFAISKPTTSTQLTGADIPASTYIIFRATVPITGWSSSTQVSDGYSPRDIVGKFTTPSGAPQTSLTTVNFGTTSFDSTASYSAGTFTIQSSGYYKIFTNISINGATIHLGDYLEINIRRSGSVIAKTSYRAVGNYTFSGPASVTEYFTAGQTVDVQVITSGVTTPSWTSGENIFTIEKSQAPTTMSATEVVAATYQANSSQSITTGAIFTVFGSKVTDTHVIYNSGTGIGTIPYSGIYHICLYMGTTTATAGGWQVGVRKNSTAINRINAAYANVTNQYYASGCIDYPFNAGDTFDLYNSSPVASGSTYNSSIDNWFSIHRIK